MAGTLYIKIDLKIERSIIKRTQCKAKATYWAKKRAKLKIFDRAQKKRKCWMMQFQWKDYK